MARKRLSNIRKQMNKGQKSSVKNLRKSRNKGDLGIAPTQDHTGHAVPDLNCPPGTRQCQVLSHNPNYNVELEGDPYAPLRTWKCCDMMTGAVVLRHGGRTSCPPGTHMMPDGSCMQGNTHPGGYSRGGRTAPTIPCPPGHTPCPGGYCAPPGKSCVDPRSLGSSTYKKGGRVNRRTNRRR